MTFHISRRKFLNAAATGVGAASLASAYPFANEAWAQKIALTGVTWGGPWLEASKAITASQAKFDIKWELHTGGAGAIIPKIKAAMPNPPYDFVAQFDPLYYTWMIEDWPEPITLEEMPSLKDMPEDYFFKNSKGQIVNIPLSIIASFFGYRKDICPFPIKKMEDLLDKRFKGKLCVRSALQGQNNNLVHYAVANGGSVDNLEPGWEFLTKLAKSGNIARFANTEVEFINSLTSGESVAGFSNITNWGKIAEQFPVEYLILDRKDAPGFQAGVYQEGVMILKTSPKKKEAKEFLNFFVNAENNAIYNNKFLSSAPPNSKSPATDNAKKIVFSLKEDRERFSIHYNWKLLSEQASVSIARFEKEILPLTK